MPLTYCVIVLFRMILSDLSDLAKYSTTRSTRGLSAKAELFVVAYYRIVYAWRRVAAARAV